MTHDRIGPAQRAAALPRREEHGERILPRLDAAARGRWPRRILVGSDGTSSAAPAITAARAIADRSSADVEMETVYRPRVPLPASAHRRSIGHCERTERGSALALLHRVQHQRRALAQYACGWPLRFEIGDPAAVIASAAAESDADLVVTGIGHFDPLGARCDGRTVLRIARHLGVTLFAAAHGCEVPARCVIAFPDGQLHAPTVRAALRLLPSGAPLWIAIPDRSSTAHPELIAEGSGHDLVVEAMGGAASDADDRHACERVDISGDMLTWVLHLVHDTGAQLVALPNRGAPGPVRVFLPNIAEPLLVAAPCSVLVVPDNLSTQ